MQPLTKQEVKNVIDGKRTTERIPNLCSVWILPELFEEREEIIREWISQQVYDMEVVPFSMPSMAEGTAEDPEFCWMPDGTGMEKEGVIDSTVYLEDWEDTELVEEMYEKFPCPDSVSLLGEHHPDHTKYVVGHWWSCYFERHWYLRGMENALTDYYLYPEEVHRYYQRLTDFYLCIIERIKKEYNVDAIWTSDDLGTQTGPFFSPEIFRTFFKPYYKQLIDKTHELGMHFWMHTCGNIEPFLEDYIEIGLDVIHPIQKYTMDEEEIARKYGGRICFMAGFDVQRCIPFGTPEEVRAEARHLINTFSRPEGKFMISMGNGATKDWQLESLQALYDEIAKAK